MSVENYCGKLLLHSYVVIHISYNDLRELVVLNARLRLYEQQRPLQASESDEVIQITSADA